MFKKFLILCLSLMLCLSFVPAVNAAEEAEREIFTSGDYRYALLDDGTAEITKYSGTDASLTVPDRLDGHTVTRIGDYAFDGCKALTSVSIPDSVTSIGDIAFAGCYDLTSVTIPDSVTSIGDWAFASCEALTSVTIPDSVTEMGANPFASCYNLQTIKVSPDHPTLATIDGVLFSKKEKKLICYPCAFTAKSYAIPQGIKEIGEGAFDGCEALTSVTIPDSVTAIGDYAFSDCIALTSVTIPGSVTAIGDSAFSGCEALTSVTIPDSVTAIGDFAFSYCSDMLCLIVAQGSAAEAYARENDIKTAVPAVNVAEEAEREIFTSGDYRYALLDDGTAEITTYLGEGAYVTVPDRLDGHKVTRIGEGAFYGCEALTSVTIPDSVTSIGDWAFASCEALTSVTIPDSVTEMGANPFVSCYKLQTIKVSPDHPTLAIIDGVLFSKTEKKLICCPCAFTAKSYAIPQGIKLIGDYAFAGCEALTSVTIPDSVTAIGNLAFCGCSRLTSVTIPDSVTAIGDRAFAGCEALTSVSIPDSVTAIGYRAFYECSDNLCLTVDRGSYAWEYAKKNGIQYTYPDSLDWLNG